MSMLDDISKIDEDTKSKVTFVVSSYNDLLDLIDGDDDGHDYIGQSFLQQDPQKNLNPQDDQIFSINN